MQQIDRDGEQIYLYNIVISQKRYSNPPLMLLLCEDGENQRLLGNFKWCKPNNPPSVMRLISSSQRGLPPPTAMWNFLLMMMFRKAR